MNVRPHSGLLPQGRENRSPRFGDADAPGYCAVLSTNDEPAATATVTNDFSRDATSFTLSSGKRAGVRASQITSFISSAVRVTSLRTLIAPCALEPPIDRSGRVPGIAPRHPPTPPHVRFSACGGWTFGNSSVSVTQSGDRRTLRRVERLLRAARRSPDWGGDRSCRAPLLRSVSHHRIQSLDWLPQFLRPCARNAFLCVHPSIATMASADSLTPLSARVSPGQGLFFPFAPLGSTECPQ